ncbi:MAG: hypothetical protein Q9167_005596 [Letrouitia subvulpina]
MALQNLPAELFIQILEYAGGASFFIESLDRLLISKRWYSYAQLILIRSLILTSKRLGNLNPLLPLSPWTRTLMAKYTENVTVKLFGYLDWTDDEFYLGPKTLGERIALGKWMDSLQSDLDDLPGFLDELSNLKTLRLAVLHEINQWNHFKKLPSYVSRGTLATLLQHIPQSLTTLELDLVGLTGFSDPDREIPHLCPLVSEHFDHLRVVRVRMWRFCNGILQIPPAVTSSPIEMLTLNLFFREPFESVTGNPTSASRCPETRERIPQLDNHELVRDLMAAASQMLPQMPRIKQFNLLWLSDVPHSFDMMVSLNCLTGESRKVGIDTNQENDGVFEDGSCW